MASRVRLPTIAALSLAVLLVIARSASEGANESIAVTRSPSPTPTTTPVPTPIRSPTITESEIAAALAKWRAAGLTDYSYKLEESCFCGFPHGMPITMTVVNGESESMTWADGTTLTAADRGYFDLFNPLASIDRFFGELQDLWATVDYLTATFDPTYGFPVKIFVDRSFHVADDESTYTITDFSTQATVQPTQSAGPIEPVELPRTGGRP
jgi:hypothetical protein